MNKITPIKGFLITHAEKKSVSFHMPGHKGQAFYRRFGYGGFLDNIMDCDITEITGADNLFQAEGIIKRSEEVYSRLYDSKKSYLLINGTSGGIIAAILASVPKGKKLIMARNSHKSIFNALTLADIQPIYAYPETIKEYGISGAISPDEIDALLSENYDAEAVILPSPNYYGICSDIEIIAEIVHKHNKVLIVDQAHGAHLKMFSKFGVGGFPKSAEESGADIVINSIHKTLGSFTQSAVLNINSKRVSKDIIEDKLQCIESTSPSYLLMASLDINGGILIDHGHQLMKEWTDNLNLFYQEAKKIKGLEYIDKISGFDWTKLNFGFGGMGISGGELEKLLIERNIYIELYTGNMLMCMTGIGNTRKDIESLIAALKEISSGAGNVVSKAETNHFENKYQSSFQRKPIFEIPKFKVWVPLLEAEGRVCASSIIPYPPGIPLVCPGEKFEEETLIYIKNLRNNMQKVIGINETGEVLVGTDENF